MATKKGKHLAELLHVARPGDTLGFVRTRDIELCSRICSNAVTYTRLEEEACSGPKWSWGSSRDWTAVIPVERFQRENEAAIAKIGARITNLAAGLHPTPFGKITVALGGDPRGYVVRLLVPTGVDEIIEVCIDEDGARLGPRRKVEA